MLGGIAEGMEYLDDAIIVVAVSLIGYYATATGLLAGDT